MLFFGLVAILFTVLIPGQPVSARDCVPGACREHRTATGGHDITSPPNRKMVERHASPENSAAKHGQSQWIDLGKS